MNDRITSSDSDSEVSSESEGGSPFGSPSFVSTLAAAPAVSPLPPSSSSLSSSTPRVFCQVKV